ncbi:DUF305 domain-containing protein [Nocardia sp. NPDC051900]|uniref:DUF305 domain-containing protein n=1 Tax=Nocardia sp. NPDC051900 TaxID=3364326 RepID=UPI0037B03B81
MIRRRWLGAATLAAFAVLLLVAGAALRPLVVGADSTAAPLLDSTETGFVQDMIAHHNQALLLVQRLDGGADPAVRALAQQIADTQRTEIGMMLGWLRMARLAVTNPHPMAWMHAEADHEHHATAAHATMPGMASQDELDALAAARGAEAATGFLRLMQRHHYGGIQMAQAADRRLNGGMVEQIARDMISTQGQEVGLIGLLLSREQAPR